MSRTILTALPWAILGLIIGTIIYSTDLDPREDPFIYLGYSQHESACGDCVDRNP